MPERYGLGKGCTTREVKDLGAGAAAPANRWQPFPALHTFTGVTQVMVSENLLAVRFGSLGDVLLTTPLLRAISQQHPQIRLTVLTSQRLAPLLSDNPRIDEVIALAPEDSLLEMGVRLRALRFSHLLDLETSPRSWLFRLLVPGRWRAAPQYRLARELLIRTKRSRFPEDSTVADRYFDAARHLGVVPDGGPAEFFLNPEAEERADTWLGKVNARNRRPFVAFAPSAGQATKRWPQDYWVRLARRIKATGAGVVFLGGPDDATITGNIAARCGAEAVNGAGVLSLQSTGAVLKRAAALVTGHTGTMHMAAALGTPLVALIGPTVRAFGYYPYNAARTVLLERNLPCRPCSFSGGEECPLKHHRCLQEIQPDAVYAALCRVLA
jgi:heptosyltransferase II